MALHLTSHNLTSVPFASKNLDDLEIGLHGLETGLQNIREALDQFFLFILGTIILLMQCGFAFLEAGSVRSKNTSNILIKNLLDSFVAGIAYWTLGYAFAYGEGNSFIGWHGWASHGIPSSELASFFFQFVFAATAATIVSGALAERCEFVAYLVYSFCITGFIYPVVTHWVWTSEGWLAKGQNYVLDGVQVNVAYTDFAGSGVLHCVGGVAAFVGAFILGPRIGRFHGESGTALPIRGHSVPFAALGGFILIFGFMAFNGGALTSISSPRDGSTISLCLVNTVIAGSGAAFTSLIIHRVGIPGRFWSLINTLNGALAGMVAICSGCNQIRPWASAIVGMIGSIAYNVTSWTMIKWRIDDPLDAVAVHFGGGLWGVISVAFLSPDKGILYKWNKESGLLLAWQFAGLAAIIAWTAVLCTIMFGLMRLLGIFRVSEEMERKGLDIPKHGEPAYPLESYGHGHTETILTMSGTGQLSSQKQGYSRHSSVNLELTSDEGRYENPELKMLQQHNASAASSVAASAPHNGNGHPSSTQHTSAILDLPSSRTPPARHETETSMSQKDGLVVC